MPCIPLPVPGGVVLACTRGGPRCSVCRKASGSLLCDGRPPEKHGKTCDAPLCAKCRRIFLDDAKKKLDLCPKCAEARLALRPEARR
jgi:hypothetical protein